MLKPVGNEKHRPARDLENTVLDGVLGFGGCLDTVSFWAEQPRRSQ
jgi:hypothetical protein